MTLVARIFQLPKRLFALLSLLAFLCWPQFSVAQPVVPALSGRVIDQTATLTPSQIASLDQTLSNFEAKKGSQIVVLIVPSTAPEAIEQYAIRVAEQWKIGRKKVDDGAILIIAKADRALRIEVGYGLEGVLTDATSKRIIDQIIVPRFKHQDFYGGITDGVNAVIGVVDGEALPVPTPANTEIRDPGDIRSFLPIIFIVALVLGGILRSMLGRLPGSLVTGGFVALISWFMFGAFSIALIAGVVALVVALSGMGLGRHGFGGYSSGGGHGGGGGFSGGGGGFGGGGSSGRW
ncbi:YgcG family protein [Polynucleobacter sp.]|uniref:TPM domain-containing protein n=1 Tax=Polynucleobacter sp. TaxID=2029855 RepID=UPI00351D1BBE